jgi:hypothetical protein
MRLAYAAMVLAASVIGLAAHYVNGQDHPSTKPAGTSPASAVPHFIFGDLHQPPPRGPSSRFKQVCTDEVRRDPAHGAWVCVGWEQVELGSQAAAAADRGGRCSARTADQATGWWRCRSTKQLITYGDLMVAPPRNEISGGYGACIQERRANPDHGPWRCTIWTEPPSWMPIREARKPRGPCMQRVVNQDTGRWDCFQTSRTSIRPLSPKWNAYRAIG